MRRHPHLMFIREKLVHAPATRRKIRCWVEPPCAWHAWVAVPPTAARFGVWRSVVSSRLPSYNLLDALARLILNTRMWISVSIDPSSAAESPERVRRPRILMAVIHIATRERMRCAACAQHLGVE